MTNKTQQVIVSGNARGSGSAKYRWVSGLSNAAKQAIETGSALVICERPFSDVHGEWYVVTATKKRSTWDHRLPTDEESKAIKAAGF